jgi:hypothetical protein
MKFWKTSIVLAWGAILPALGYAQDYWVEPAGYGAPMGAVPQDYGYGYCPPGGGGDLYQQLVPESHFRFRNDATCDLSFKEAFSQTYVRLDYLQWQIDGGKNSLLGAPNSSGADLSGRDPNNMLLASDQAGPRAPVPTAAVVPSLPSNHDTLSGLHALIGVPTRVGTWETEMFYFEQLDNGVRVNPYTASNNLGASFPVIAATTLLTDGVISSNNMILYSDSYFARETATFFGAEMNWILPPAVPNVPVTVSPIVGFRYINFGDKLEIGGTDSPNANDPPPVDPNEPVEPTILNHYIGSIARNNIFGPQFGFRVTTHVGRLDLGVEPKFIAGINRVSEGVYTREIYSPTEDPRASKDQRTEFTPVFDLSLSGKFHVSDRFALYASYEFMLAGNFSRSYRNVYYNSSANIADPPQIGLRSDLASFFAQGFSVGGELTFR